MNDDWLSSLWNEDWEDWLVSLRNEDWLLSLWVYAPYLLLFLAVLVAFRVISLPRRAKGPQRLEREVRAGGMTRSFILHLPANLPSRKDWRVLIVYHPAFGSGAFMEETTRLHELPGSEDFILVYPDGFARTWNAGICCGPAKRQNIDDLGFFDAILADVGKQARIRKKACVAGFSNGAHFVYYLMCHRGDRLAAAVAFAGYLPPAEIEGCPPARVPLFQIQGAMDNASPFEGGDTHYMGDLPPVREAVEVIARRNGCDVSAPRRVSVPELDSTGLQYTGDSAEAEASLCIVSGLGHVWPGAGVSMAQFGPAREELAGSEVMLEFFLNH